jgi:Family of unknown function (DUF6521)
VGLAERAAQLTPIAREAVLFLSAHGLITVTDEGAIVPAGAMARGKASILAASADVKTCVGKAKMVGAWFAEAGDAVTVYQMWGVRPWRGCDRRRHHSGSRPRREVVP